MAEDAEKTGDSLSNAISSIINVNRQTARLELKKYNEGLNQLVDGAREYQRNPNSHNAQRFAGSLITFGEKTDLDQVHAGIAIKQVESLRSLMLQQLDADFIHPLDNFIKTELPAVAEAERRLKQAREEFDSQQVKYDQSAKKKKADKAVKIEQELAEAQLRFDLAEQSYVNKLREVEARRQFEITDRICDLLLAQFTFYKQGYELLRAVEPQIQEAKQRIAQSKKDYVTKVNTEQTEEALLSPKKATLSGDGASKQGYLTKVGKRTKSGKRRWVIVGDGSLSLYKSWKDKAAGTVKARNSIDLKLCNVKKTEQDKEKPKTAFVLTSPDRAYVFEAASQSELDEWISVIQANIALQLKRPAPVASTPSTPSIDLKLTLPPDASHSAFEAVRAFSPANKLCADCGRADPEWAAYNLAVVICMDCSGVHRSLGTHISRVKSLTLDTWDPTTLFLLRQFGNATANEVWEEIPSEAPEDKKIKEDADRAARERYIKAKYVQKKFVKKTASDAALFQLLVNAASENDCVGLLRALAQGVDVNFPRPDSPSTLHILLAEGKANAYTVEFLLQNGARPSVPDSKGWTPLHHAARGDLARIAAALLRYGAAAGAEDAEKKTPLEIAAKYSSNGVIRVLSGDTAFLDSISPRRSPKSSARGTLPPKRLTRFLLPDDKESPPSSGHSSPRNKASPEGTASPRGARPSISLDSSRDSSSPFVSPSASAEAATPSGPMPEDDKFVRLQEATLDAIQGMHQRVAAIRAAMATQDEAAVLELLRQVRAAHSALLEDEPAAQ